MGHFLEKRLIFEGNCQTSTWWMLATLWGFFWFNGIFFIVTSLKRNSGLIQQRFYVIFLASQRSSLLFQNSFMLKTSIQAIFEQIPCLNFGYQAIMMGLHRHLPRTLQKTFPSIGSAFT